MLDTLEQWVLVDFYLMKNSEQKIKKVVIIPTYNESENIKFLLDKLVDLNLNCLIIDDGSPDGTAKIVSEHRLYKKNIFLIDRGSKNGYASACIEGFNWALNQKFETIIQMDADHSHSYTDLEIMLSQFSNTDLLIGSRYIKGGRIVGWGYFRKVLSKSANIFARKMTRSKLNDLTSGFRIYNASIFEKINLNHIHSEGYGFLVEVLNQINNEGFKIKEFPITFNDRERGKSKMSAKVIIDGVKNTIFIGIKNFGLKKYI